MSDHNAMTKADRFKRIFSSEPFFSSDKQHQFKRLALSSVFICFIGLSAYERFPDLVSSAAGGTVENYFPMHDGDVWNYQGYLGVNQVTVEATIFNARSVFAQGTS